MYASYAIDWRSWRTFNDLNNEADLQVGHYEYVDQLANLIEGLKADPTGRRHILSAWNPGELQDMALPPCHMFAQFYVQPYSQEERIQIMERDFPTTSPRTNGFFDKDKMLDMIAHLVHLKKFQMEHMLLLLKNDLNKR